MRFACLLGGLGFCVGVLLTVGVVVEHIWRNHGPQIGISGVLAGVLLLSGIQLIVLGIVGAGGVGFVLAKYMALFQYQKLLGAMLVIIATVTVIDRVSDALRRRII